MQCSGAKADKQFHFDPKFPGPPLSTRSVNLKPQLSICSISLSAPPLADCPRTQWTVTRGVTPGHHRNPTCWLHHHYRAQRIGVFTLNRSHRDLLCMLLPLKTNLNWSSTYGKQWSIDLYDSHPNIVTCWGPPPCGQNKTQQVDGVTQSLLSGLNVEKLYIYLLNFNMCSENIFQIHNFHNLRISWRLVNCSIYLLSIYH